MVDIGVEFKENHPGTTHQTCIGDYIMMTLIRSFARDTRGATMIEYGLIAALVAVVLIVALTVLGEGLGGMFNNVTAEL